MNCLDGSLGSCVGGSWLQNYSYVVLEHGMMDKKCRVCPNHHYNDLERAVTAWNRAYYIGFKPCFSCAKAVHITCVKRFLKKVETDTNICHDVQEFINCYKEAVVKKRCSGRSFDIVKSFYNLCSQLGERMLKEDEKHPRLMC
ncbi:uncharacterized protein LOC111336170 [Stylophora pistillata]|uniref:uncharacterized protein LOC111336170 n=1 Tax=Stylophora pistillata TaxID=50429 RepID=UPI000C0394E5|nr:uncharacterized protein LOC111336170 [Stylophora pistillata]